MFIQGYQIESVVCKTTAVFIDIHVSMACCSNNMLSAFFKFLLPESPKKPDCQAHQRENPHTDLRELLQMGMINI